MIMRNVVRRILIVCVLAGVSLNAFAFVVHSIRFQGLKHISPKTAMSYVHIKTGRNFSAADSTQVIQALFKTGFFQDVKLLRDGNTLIIKVQERPVISRIKLSGNKVIKAKELLQVLRKLNIADGYEYNRSSLKIIRTALLSQYYAHGKYNARVHVSATQLKNNRVAIDIAISEGLVSTIKQIHIIGNHKFSEKNLLGQFKLSTPGFFSWFTHDDEYSSEKLAGDLHALSDFYLNHGYLKMRIESSQVSLSPDRKHVYIVIKIAEGPQYHFSGFNLAGKLIVSRKKLRSLVSIKSGDIYSKQEVVASEKAMGYAIGDKGYARVKITPTNMVLEKKHTVNIQFNIKPGRIIYVRHITFTGNEHTDDNALRRALTQMEGGMATSTHLTNSKRNLMLLPFVQNVQEVVTPVPGKNNEEDINYKMATYPGGEIQAGVGYSDLDGFLINASLSQSNFYGTGNQFSISASRSQSTLNGTISYYNPYYTPWGVGRGFSVYASRFNAGKQNIADYATNNYGAAVNYSIPLSLHNSLQLGIGVDYLHIALGEDPANVMNQFQQSHGNTFEQILLNAGWTFNDLDRTVFPTKGLFQNLALTVSAPVARHSLKYYTGDYKAHFYYPIYHSFIFTSRAEIGYGNGYGEFQELPFFKNFYAGGLGTVAGYTANTLGPQDQNGNALGGDILVAARLGIIFPNPISKSLRTLAFVDGGNVFDTKASELVKSINPDSNGLRYSAGLEVDWLTPFTGVLKFSVAKAINPSKGDDTSIFQFNIGTSF